MAMSETTAAPLARAHDPGADVRPSAALDVDWPGDHKALPATATTVAQSVAERDARAGIVRSLHALDPQTGSGTALRDTCIDCGVEVRGIDTTLHMAARPDGDGMGPLCATCWQMRANAPEPEDPDADLGTSPSMASDAETPRERRRHREPSG